MAGILIHILYNIRCALGKYTSKTNILLHLYMTFFYIILLVYKDIYIYIYIWHALEITYIKQEYDISHRLFIIHI